MNSIVIEIRAGIYQIQIAQMPMIEAAEALGAAQAGLDQLKANLTHQMGADDRQEVFATWVEQARQRAIRMNSQGGTIHQMIQ